MMHKLKNYIKKKETKTSRILFDLHHWFINLTLPAPRIIFLPLLKLHISLRGLISGFLMFFYWKPLFLQYLHSKPKQLLLENTLPFIIGNPEIKLGEKCRINGNIVISAKSKTEKNPLLRIGDRVGIQYNCQFFIADEIIIGSDCRLAEGCILRGYSGHSVHPGRRKQGLPEDSHERGSIRLANNVWLGFRVMVMQGVEIGENTVVASGSIVTHSLPANVVAGGIPAKIIRSIDEGSS